MFVAMPKSVPMQSGSTLPWNIGGIPPHVKKAIQADQELNGAVEAYVQRRRLLEVYREAFLQADGIWRADAWIATLASVAGAPHNFVKAKYRQWKMNRAIEAAKLSADAAARDIVSAVDSMAA